MVGRKDLRTTVIALFIAGKLPMQIFRQLKNLNVSRNFVYYTIKNYKDISSVDDRPRSGRLRSVRTKNNIKVVRERLRRSPCRSLKNMALQVKISRSSVSRILKQDLKVRSYSRRKDHHLNERLKKIRLDRCRPLLRRHDGKNILFTDKKIFTVEEKYNRQNHKVYARSSREVPPIARNIQRSHHPASAMVWWGVSYEGVTEMTELHFCKQGLKIKAKNYQSDIMDTVVKPLSSTLFKNSHIYIFIL